MDTPTPEKPRGETPGGPPPAPERREPLALLLLAAGALGALYYLVDPAAGSGLFWACPFHKITGLHCPGCGGQRALHELLHGRITAALSANALAVLLVFPAVFAAAAAHVLNSLGLARVRPPQPGNRGLLLLGVVALAFAVLRNLPVPPLDWLAP